MGARLREKVKTLLMDVAKQVLNKDLDVAKHSEGDVRAVIDAFPDVLSAPIGAGYLMMQLAMAAPKTLPFIPLFAEVGDRLNVGGEGMRGGLLVPIPCPSDPSQHLKYNLIQLLARYEMNDGSSGSSCDSMCLTVMKRLRQSNLLTKEDIKHFSLSSIRPNPRRKATFEYLVDWDPLSLKFRRKGELCLHVAVRLKSVGDGSFAMVLQAGLKHYPEELGLLFEKNRKGKTAWELAFEKYGKDETWTIIETCFDNTRDPRIVEKSPAANLYPFVIAAAGETSDLSMLYYLLRRHPEVLYRTQCLGNVGSGKRKRLA